MFTITGAPRTKKNHQRIMRTKAGKPFIMQAKTADAWAKEAVKQLSAQAFRHHWVPVQWDVNMRALFYRDRAVGDLGNYLAALCDAMQVARVVTNDKFIGGFDGSRLLIDRKNPRVEFEVLPLAMVLSDQIGPW